MATSAPAAMRPPNTWPRSSTDRSGRASGCSTSAAGSAGRLFHLAHGLTGPIVIGDRPRRRRWSSIAVGAGRGRAGRPVNGHVLSSADIMAQVAIRAAVRRGHLEPRRPDAHPRQDPPCSPASSARLAPERPPGHHRLRPGRRATSRREFRRLHRQDRLSRRRPRQRTAGCSKPQGSWTSTSRTPRSKFVDILRTRDAPGWRRPAPSSSTSFSEADLDYIISRWKHEGRASARPAT